MPRRSAPSVRRENAADVIVVGGGVMGSACAWQLARAGARVVVLEKSVPGAEASSAAAGILGAHAEAHGPGAMADLLRASLARHAGWAELLARATGIDVEYRRSGILRVAFEAEGAKRLSRRTAWMRREGLGAERLDARAVRTLEPALSPMAGGIRFPDDARVDPKRLFRAVHLAALGEGVRFEAGAAVRRIVVESGRVRGVTVEGGTAYLAPKVIVAAGSWSTLVPGTPLGEGTVIPARGQIVELEAPAPLLGHVVMGPRGYLVPRDDGRVLVGATVEFVGYRRGVTARGVRDLLAAAIELVPALAEAALLRTWSSFRPYTKDELPVLGRTDVEGLLLATGHYRNGILLAPITAEILLALVLGKRPPLDIAPFESSRFAVRTPPRRSRRR